MATPIATAATMTTPTSATPSHGKAEAPLGLEAALGLVP